MTNKINLANGTCNFVPGVINLDDLNDTFNYLVTIVDAGN